MTVMQKSSAAASTGRTERQWSYTNGTSDTPLLGLTIENIPIIRL